MKTIALKLTPLDVLFFRDARPFDQADLAGSGLPTPQSFYGLIKTYFATVNKLPFSKIHGLRRSNDENRWISAIRTRGVWLYRDEGIEKSIFVTVPSDIVQLGKKGDTFSRLRPVTKEADDEEPVPGWNDPYGPRPLWTESEESPRAASGFLKQSNLKKYLEGEFLWTKNDIVTGNDLYGFESRTGIGVDSKTMVAADSQIYSASFLRLKPGISFYGEVEIDDEHHSKLESAFNSPIVLPWGGEGRRVHIDMCEQVDWPDPPPTNGNTRLLSLLITPGIFGSRDARGQNGNGPERQPSWKPRELGTLTAASVPRPTPISGWNLSGHTDIADSGELASNDESNSDSQQTVLHGCPRPTRYAAPAGSVYFWELGRNNRSVKAGKEIPPLQSLCGKPLEADAGWGLSLTGVWKPFNATSNG